MSTDEYIITKAGIDIMVIKSLLGHSDLRTTEIYAQVIDSVRSVEMRKLRFE